MTVGKIRHNLIVTDEDNNPQDGIYSTQRIEMPFESFVDKNLPRKLSPKLVQLRYFDELSYEEIARRICRKAPWLRSRHNDSPIQKELLYEIAGWQRKTF